MRSCKALLHTLHPKKTKQNIFFHHHRVGPNIFKFICMYANKIHIINAEILLKYLMCMCTSVDGVHGRLGVSSNLPSGPRRSSSFTRRTMTRPLSVCLVLTVKAPTLQRLGGRSIYGLWISFIRLRGRCVTSLTFSLTSCCHARPVCPQLQAPRDPGARPLTRLPAVRRKADRLLAVQQPEEPRQVPRARAGLLSEKLRRR